MVENEIREADIAYVLEVYDRGWVHVDDPEARQAFLSEKCIFDVDPQHPGLTAFFERHRKLKAQIDGDAFKCQETGLLGNRPLYYAFKRTGDKGE